jgi:hypothetical protein
MSSRLALLVSAALLLGGCKETSDIGKPCLLVKRGTGSEAAPVTRADLKDGQDFVSFGSLDCEDLVCVLDADTPVETAENGQVKGYCSKACQAEAVDTCAVTDPDAIESVRTRMACRPLLLDQKALEDLKATDPATYRATFGENTSPYFCAAEPPPASN